MELLDKITYIRIYVHSLEREMEKDVHSLEDCFIIDMQVPSR